jgi:hypothetical protein
VARRAGKALGRLADRDDSGTLTWDDATRAKDEAAQAIEVQVSAVKRGLERDYAAAKKAARDGVKAAYDAADLNRDKQVDAADAALAKEVAVSVARATAALAEAKAAAGFAAAKQALDDLGAKGRATLAAAEKAVQPDNLVRVGGALKKAVVDGATGAYDAAAKSVSRAGDTLATGYTQASERTAAAWGRLTTFVRGG